VNRIVDYGSFSTINTDGNGDDEKIDDSRYYLLKFMHEKDPVTGEYVKAYYLHLFLDHLKETRFKDYTKAIDEFLNDNVLAEIVLPDGTVLSFAKELDEIITFVKDNQGEILDDVHGACYRAQGS
jgi:hypothetical protein